MNQDVAKREADIPLTCLQYPRLAVATLHGLYSDGWRIGLVTRYVGSAIGPLGDAPLGQRYYSFPCIIAHLIHSRKQLLTALRVLHQRGIHHHDVRPANVMVDKFGVVTLTEPSGFMGNAKTVLT